MFLLLYAHKGASRDARTRSDEFRRWLAEDRRCAALPRMCRPREYRARDLQRYGEGKSVFDENQRGRRSVQKCAGERDLLAHDAGRGAFVAGFGAECSAATRVREDGVRWRIDEGRDIDVSLDQETLQCDGDRGEERPETTPARSCALPVQADARDHRTVASKALRCYCIAWSDDRRRFRDDRLSRPQFGFGAPCTRFSGSENATSASPSFGPMLAFPPAATTTYWRPFSPTKVIGVA